MLILLTGAPGTGKTWYIKEMLRKWGFDESEILALDINNEYETKYRFYDHHTLIETASKLRNKVVIFEEATSFFSSNNSRDVKRFFTTHRHNKLTIFANFHSLATVPADLLMCTDYLYFTETMEKNPPKWVGEMEPYTLYDRGQIIQMQS